MRIFRPATVLMVVAALAVGCGAVVDGTAKPAPNLKSRPLTGATVTQVLLDGATLSRMLSQPFVARDPAEFGGPGKLHQVKGSTSAAGCLGVTAMLQKGVYQSGSRPAQVEDVASQSWWNNGQPAQVITVIEGVVTFRTTTEAEALFAQFSQQWQQCNGMTTTEHDGPISTTNVISDVRVAGASNTVVAATKTATSVLPNMPALQPTPQARAIGIRSNCLVEVEVVFYGGRRSSDPGSADISSSAIDIANAMMDKVSELS
jgi:PknH-like extracellular domain